MDETPPAAIQDDTPNGQPQVTPQNAQEAAAAAATALAEAQFPDIKEKPVTTPEPVVTTPEVSTDTQGQPAAETSEVSTEEEPAAETTETPEEEVEEDYSAQVQPPQPIPQLDASRFVDENGYVDVKAMADAFNQSLSQVQLTASSAAQRELNAQRIEERQWNQATERFPQLKTDRTLRDIVQNARIGKTTELYQRAGNDPQALAAIRIPTPAQIASDLFKRLGDAKSQGVKAATENVSIQQTARLETASTPGDVTNTNKKAELFSQIRDTDPIKAKNAQIGLLKELMFEEQ